MLKKKIKYTDYNGAEREEDFYFNLSKAELSEMELSTTGGLRQMLDKIIAEQDTVKLAEFFKKIILKSYGEKSADGKHFYKRNGELANDFAETEAYVELYMELATDAEAATKFVNGILPSEIRKELDKM